jgi:hypothetical protein
MDDAAGLKRIEAKVQQKINDGATVAHKLVNLTAPTPLTEKEVTDLLWYLQARGELKTGTNNAPDITYTLPDPHGHILRSFDLTFSANQGPLAYQRDSSHLTGFQKADQGNAPRGVNMIPQNGTDYDRLLPHENQTVLYQKMSQTVNGYPEDRIFIKPESHGMWYSNPDKRDPNGPRRDALPGDKTHSIGHSLSFFGSMSRKASGNNSPEGSFKERVPPDLIGDYKALVAKAPSQLRTLLLRNDPTGDSSGLHVMLENISQANSQAGYVDLEFVRAVANFNQKYGSGSNPIYDNPTRRIGQEIIFDQADL